MYNRTAASVSLIDSRSRVKTRAETVLEKLLLPFSLDTTTVHGHLKTSRPKARDGHRYPRPAERSVYGSLLSKQGFGPEGGRSPVEHRGNLYVRPSVRLSS